MRMAELSRVTGVPSPTIKFYIRDGLLPKGKPTARNQALYGQEHVDRIRLIKALTVVGRLPLETETREVLEAIDTQFVQRALAVIAGGAPVVEEIVAAAEMLGVVFSTEQLAVYRQAAEMLERLEVRMCDGSAAATIVLTSLLGDALIVAMRNKVRMEPVT